MTTRTRLRKRPHNLHRCSNVEELSAELESRDIDPVALVREFVKASAPVGVLVAGSIAYGVATELSDLDLLILAPSHDVFKERRRDIAGNAVRYLPTDSADLVQVSLFIEGIEIDLTFVVDPAPGRDEPSARPSEFGYLNRLVTGWVLDGHDVVERWRHHFGAGGARIRWMTAEFTSAAKNLEDMEAGIGLAPGHVPALGAGVVSSLMRALLAYSGCYCTSRKWLIRVGRLIDAADPEMRGLLVAGRELAFPGLLSGAAEEREYFRRVHAYCAQVRDVLTREEGVDDILAAVTHDLDLIV